MSCVLFCIFVCLYVKCFFFFVASHCIFVYTFVKGMMVSGLYGLLIMFCFYAFVLMYDIGIKFDMIYFHIYLSQKHHVYNFLGRCCTALFKYGVLVILEEHAALFVDFCRQPRQLKGIIFDGHLQKEYHSFG